MGQLFSGIINGDKTKQQAQDMSDFLDNSQVMLEQRHQLFVDQVLNSAESQRQLPVSRFLQKNFELRVSMEKGVDIGQQVADIAGKFADKKFAQAIGSTISVVTDIIFGRSSGQLEQQTGYFILVGMTGAIMRIDYLVYLKTVKASGLINLAQNFYLCSYMISSVDTKNLTFNDYASAVQLCYASLPIQDRTNLIKIIRDQNGQQLSETMK